MDADILIQAGHEGLYRNSGTGRVASHGTAGLPVLGDEEYKLTPIVADEAARLLRAAGYSVIREDAFYDKVYNVKVAVSVHFDGSATPCASGTSVGYPAGSPAGSNKPAVDIWKSIWLTIWPFRVMPDNFTAALRGFYGYSRTNTSIAEFLIEFGELTCPEQNAWLVERVHNGFLGHLLAYALDKILGGNKITAATPPASGTNIIGPPEVSIARMEEWARKNKATDKFVNLAKVAHGYSRLRGVRPAITYSVMAKETAFGRFGNVLDESFHNWGGMKVTKGGDDFERLAHAQFRSDEEGVRAVVDHLYLYAVGVLADTPDPRHFAWLAGKCPTLESPSLWSGRAGDSSYGISIRDNYVEKMLAVPAPPDDVWEAIRRINVRLDKLENR